MKEKIKNFLLKIKNTFNIEMTFKLKELIVICLTIYLLCLTLTFCDVMANDYCFNETHTEQVEETPQTESIRIDRDIKGANPTQSDYVNPSSYYHNIFFNVNFSDTTILDSLTYVSFLNNNGYPIYVTSLFDDSSNPSSNTYDLLYILKSDVNNFYYVYYSIIDRVGTTVTESPYFFEVASFDGNGIDINSYISTRFNYVVTNFLGQIPIGTQNQLLYNFISTQRFESSSTPSLENAPSTLVNTLPTNALTTAPSGIGTLVYDTGSHFVGLPTGSNANTLGVQIYYKSTWNQTTTSTYVEYEGINYYYNKPTPTITLSEVNVVIYTLWDDTTIYYNVGNVLDTPLTNYAVTSFDFFNWFNMFYSSVNVIQEYSDYWHLDFDIDYQVEYQNKVTAEYGNVISYVDYGFEMLIPHNVLLTDIGYKGFSMEKFIELDSNYNSAYIWIGEQTATNFVNQVFDRLYDNAYEDGDSDGFARGFDLNGDAYENATNPILNFINKGASIISNVLNVEVLPNITLGTIFLFPLVIAMIWFVVKLFMGG